MLFRECIADSIPASDVPPFFTFQKQKIHPRTFQKSFKKVSKKIKKVEKNFFVLEMYGVPGVLLIGADSRDVLLLIRARALSL